MDPEFTDFAYDDKADLAEHDGKYAIVHGRDRDEDGSVIQEKPVVVRVTNDYDHAMQSVSNLNGAELKLVRKGKLVAADAPDVEPEPEG